MNIFATLLEMSILDATYYDVGGKTLSVSNTKIIKKNIDNNSYILRLKNLPDLFVYFINEEELDDSALTNESDVLLDSDDLHNIVSIKSPLSPIFQTILDRKKTHPSACHYIFSHNESANTIVPTPWMVAHRFVHTLCMAQILKMEGHHIGQYSFPLEYQVIDGLQMKSVKSDNFDVHSIEWIVEMFTEIMINGKLRFDMDKALNYYDGYDYSMNVDEARTRIQDLINDFTLQIKHLKLAGLVFKL